MGSVGKSIFSSRKSMYRSDDDVIQAIRKLNDRSKPINKYSTSAYNVVIKKIGGGLRPDYKVIITAESGAIVSNIRTSGSSALNDAKRIAERYVKDYKNKHGRESFKGKKD